MMRTRAPSTVAGCFALLLAGGLGARSLSAQTVYGVLLERESNRPIDLALVMLLTPEGDSVATVLTDEAGEFRLEAGAPGDYRLAASALGYVPTLASSLISLPRGTSITLEFRLESQPIEIEGVTVETMASKVREPRLVRNGFVDRAREGLGKFISPWEIEASLAPSTSDLLMRTGRVTTRYSVGGDEVIMRGTAGYCAPTVYVDGFRVTTQDFPLDMIAPKELLEAAEVYRSPVEAPARFGGGMPGGCGIIVLWTRMR